MQKYENLVLVDLEKCCKMSILLQKSASIQPRKDLPKSRQPTNTPTTPPWGQIRIYGHSLRPRCSRPRCPLGSNPKIPHRINVTSGCIIADFSLHHSFERRWSYALEFLLNRIHLRARLIVHHGVPGVFN